jgi:N-acetylglutamate synthase-like GNAT family acetyltransferase
MTIVVRQATWQDLDALEQLYTEAMRPYVESTHQWNEKLFREKFDPTHIQVLTEQGRTIGMLKVIREAIEIFFADLQLLPQYRNQGIGSCIIAKIAVEADQIGLPIRLKVLRGNPVKRLYEQFGFQTISETETAFHMKRQCDALQLRSNDGRILIKFDSVLIRLC